MRQYAETLLVATADGWQRVRCRILLDWPERGLATVVREDTGAELGRRPLTAAEAALVAEAQP
jgi:hypothetical protein